MLEARPLESGFGLVPENQVRLGQKRVTAKIPSLADLEVAEKFLRYVRVILIPQITVWGGGALLIRECIRRWRKGWQSMLVMGLALAVAEEWLIQQTSISPLVASGECAYGRVWGVNWVYFLWGLGYESVWVVLVPVQLTELLFPGLRDACWLRPEASSSSVWSSWSGFF